VKGSHKAEMLKSNAGTRDYSYPASIVQLHPNCEILLDADAAARIVGKVRI